MGSIVLFIALFIEIVFTAYCFKTRFEQNKIWSSIQVGAFGIFTLLALLSVVQWSFRWFLFGGLLFVWAVIGSIRIIRRNTSTRIFSPVRSIAGSIGTFLLVFITIIPVLIFPQYKLPEPTGKFEVATANFTFTDEIRIETFTNLGEKRNVNVEFWYPGNAEGTFPLVVFSHGTGGLKISNTSTFRDLASNGYVVCSIDHPYHSLFTIGADRKLIRMDSEYWKEYLDVVNGKYDDESVYQIHKEWIDLRAADINLVLDSIKTRVEDKNQSGVYKLIDPARIGLIGHSLGGEAAALMPRLRKDIRAVVTLDADLSGEYTDFIGGKEVLNNSPYKTPILVILADSMSKLVADAPNPDDVALNHVLASNSDAFLVHLPGTNHFSVTDLPLVSPFFVSVMTNAVPGAGGGGSDPYLSIQRMNDTILNFFDAYLKGEGSFTP